MLDPLSKRIPTLQRIHGQMAEDFCSALLFVRQDPTLLQEYLFAKASVLVCYQKQILSEKDGFDIMVKTYVKLKSKLFSNFKNSIPFCYFYRCHQRRLKNSQVV
eukprot:TRINITY_DN26607_c1_g2_i2.p3 TRINITY_DN26607_c1_g2~~TRINITY_DN26607_c1_g2_i2.p3  ORF type:complete len:104 (+),score=1.08 TRINITY_DN26607_c1_g2_i2:671-982(+)